MNALLQSSFFSIQHPQFQLVDLRTVLNAKSMEVRCPNCGSHAERHYLASEQVTRTQCPTCDYLMVTCSRTGRVIEAYAPGRYHHH